MNTRFQDLDYYQLDDGTIRLEQIGYAGEAAIIDLHHEQVLFVARSLCGMKPETAHKVAELERRIAVLTDKLQHIVCNSAFRSDLIEGIGEGFEYLAKLDGLLDLAMEFDGGRLTPEYKEAPDDDGKPIYPPSAITQAKKTQPDATVTASKPKRPDGEKVPAGQLGLEV